MAELSLMTFGQKTEQFGELEKSTHVRVARIEEMSEGVTCQEATLSTDEEKRFGNLTSQFARQSFIAARALLRLALSTYVAVPPQTWRIEVDHFGAIFISEDQNPFGIRINLSKSRVWVACIISSVSCGVDIEDTRRLVDPLADAVGVFTPVEIAELSALSEAKQYQHFFKIWCLKEAYAKARGVGFHLNPQSIEVNLRDEKDIRVAVRRPDNTTVQDTADYQLQLFYPDEHHIVATAHKAAGSAVRSFEICIQDEIAP